jgi:hypothetical protein
MSLWEMSLWPDNLFENSALEGKKTAGSAQRLGEPTVIV